MSISFYGNIDVFRRKSEALIAALGQEATDSVKEAARAHVEGMDDSTPARNRGAGEGKIAKDILQVLKGVPQSTKVTASTAHRQARNSSGQTRKSSRKIRVNQADLQKLIKRQTRKAGKLKSGTNAAKRALGLSVPSWLSRHGDGQGDFSIESEGASVVARIVNNVPYASRVRSLMTALPSIRAVTAARLREAAARAARAAANRAGF